MSEYPDHLNPFKESDKNKLGKTLTRSFRGLKGFLRQSFRKKKSKSSQNTDSEDVVIRKHNDDQSYNTLRNNVMSLPTAPTYSAFTSPPLPRSRFKERLSRSSLNESTLYDERCNPFAEEDGLNPFEDPPVPYRRRRSKKKAPILPSGSHPEVNFGYKTRGSSKWSLTSSDTDFTIDDKSEYSGDVTYSHSLRQCLDNFNKEMDTLNKGSLEMGGSSPNILAGARTKILEETEYTTKSEDYLGATYSREINNNVSVEQNGYKNHSGSEETVLPRIPDSGENCEEETRSQSTHHDLEDPNEDVIKDEQKDDHKNSNDVEPIVGDTVEEQVGREELETDKEEVIVYTETKNIDDREPSCINKVKIYIDQDNGVSEHDETENSEDSKESSPIPKFRKTKLERDVLTGDSK